MGIERHLKVFKNGRNRAVRIPVEFEFSGDEIIMRKEGDKITIEPVESGNGTFFQWLSKQEPIEDEFPDVDEGLLPLRDIEL